MIPAQQFGVVGDRGCGDYARIEIRTAEHTDGTRTITLGAGNFAQVFDGQVRLGRFVVPVAVKVQRSVPRNREEHRAVEAKFDGEAATHLRLRSDRSSKYEYPIVEMIDWGASDQPGPTKIAPSILCPHARHALTPLCPKCAVPLTEDPWAADESERVLSCSRCGDRHGESEESKLRLRNATVRRDPACQGCAKSEDDCHRSASIFNFFPARVLLFERQDLDLDSYVRQAALPADRRQPTEFWRRETEAAPWVELAERIDILGQALEGIAYLHARSVAHLDVKPANLCIRAEGGRPRLKVIDLGLADDAHTQDFLRQAGGVMNVNSPFAPPEMRETPTIYLGTFVRAGGKFMLHRAPTDASWNPAVLPGDAVDVRGPAGPIGQGVVINVEVARRLTIRWDEPPAEGPPTQDAEVVVRKGRGPAADLYSFGMLVLAVLTQEAEPTAYQESIGPWSKAIAELPARGADAGEVWERLRREEVFRRLDDELARYGPARPYAEDAVSLALRLACRSGDGQCVGHLRNRNGDTAAALTDVSRQWQALSAALKDFGRLRSAEVVRQRMKRSLPLIETAMNFPPPRSVSVTKNRWVLTPTEIERRILEFETSADGTARMRVLALLGHYGLTQEALKKEIRNYFDPPKVEALPAEVATKSWVPVTLVEPPVPTTIPNESTILGVLYFALAAPLKWHAPEWGRFRAQPVPDRRWQSTKDLLVACQAEYTEHFQILKDFVGGAEEVALGVLRKKWERSDGSKGPKPHEFELKRSLRKELREHEAKVALDGIGDIAKQTKALHEQLAVEFKTWLAQWAKLPVPLKTALAVGPEQLKHRWTQQQREHALWTKALEAHLNDLNRYLGDVKQHFLGPWDAKASAKGIFQSLGISGPSEYTKFSIGYELVDDVPEPNGTLKWFREYGFGPTAEAWAGILWEYRRSPTK